ncbi:MAG: MFS transporter [Promethearchaeota archaeon]
MEDSLLLPPRELKGKRLIGYSMGDLGLSLGNIFLGVFIFQYYVYTINLNALLVSIGTTTQLIIGALFSIIFGVIVDNKRPGKLGKRRPFLLIGIPIWFITGILIWIPPWKCPEGNSMYIPTAIYFWVLIIIRSISRSLLFNVYVSMLPEQSQTLKNRESVASIRSGFAITASIVALLLPIIIQSIVEDPTNVKWWQPSGKIVLFYIPIIAVCFAIFGLIAVIIIFFSVDESFHKKSPPTEKKKISLTETFKGMALPAKDRNFRFLIIAGFFGGISGRIVGVLVFPFQTYVLNFTAGLFYFYVLISILGKYGWYLVWMRLRKRNQLLKSYSYAITLAIIASFLGTFFLVGILPFELQIILYILTWSTVLGSMYSVPLFSIPITAALVNEAAEDTNDFKIDEAMSKISGSYYGLSQFIASMGPATASIFIGFLLSGANESNATILVLLFVSMGIFYFIAFLAIRKIRIKQTSLYNYKQVES